MGCVFLFQGVLLWEKGETNPESREKSVEQFVVVAKLNPQDGAAFRYLGDYYTLVSPEPQRAIKCYQRAVSLNPDDSNAGVPYSFFSYGFVGWLWLCGNVLSFLWTCAFQLG